MGKGWIGKVLRVNLTEGTCAVEKLNEARRSEERRVG